MRDFLSKFGEEIKESIRIIISRRSFLHRIKQNPTYNRPKEGDLIYVPYLRGTGELFEITFVNLRKDFYALGRKNPYYYELTLEAFKYSNEEIATGIPTIDNISITESYTLSFTLGAGSGNYNVFETVYQGANLASATAEALVATWNAPTKTLNVTNITGVFSDNSAIIGATSNAQYTLITYDPLQNNLNRQFDNEIVSNEGRGYIDESENNPLGNV